MALGSRLKAVEQRLVTIIDARTPGLDGVTVDRGHPGEHLQREHIFLGRITFVGQFKTLGPTPPLREQDISAEIWVYVTQEGDDVTTLKNRVYDLADEVEEALRADPSLDGAVEFGGVTSGESDTFPTPDARVAYVQLEATYKARKG